MIRTLVEQIILFAHRPKTSNVSSCREYKISREWNQCLFSNKLDRLFVAKSYSTIDLWEQLWRLDINPQALIRDPIMHQAYQLAPHHKKIWRKQRACFGAQRLAPAYSNDTSCPHCKKYSTHMSSSSSNFNKFFSVANLFTQIVKKTSTSSDFFN